MTSRVSASPRAFSRAAASSIASGRPSTKRQISATVSAVAGVSSNRGRAARARSTKSCTAAEATTSPADSATGSASGSTASRTSPGTWSTSRLVASTRTSGHSPSTAAATRAASGTTTSHASRSRTASPSRRRAIARASGSAPRASTAAATRRATSSGTSRSREVDAPRAGFGFERAGDLHCESTLPDAWRPRQRHEPVLAQQLDDVGDLLLAADERRRRSRQVPAAPRRDGDGGDRRIVREDGLLEPPQVGAWLERHLLREHPPGLAVGLERVGLAAAAVEREHQLPPKPLPERVLLERRTKRGDDLAVFSERERRLELLFERVDSKRLEPPRLRAEPRSVGEPVQRRAAPEL